jgi:hypothetical protein
MALSSATKRDRWLEKAARSARRVAGRVSRFLIPRSCRPSEEPRWSPVAGRAPSTAIAPLERSSRGAQLLKSTDGIVFNSGIGLTDVSCRDLT